MRWKSNFVVDDSRTYRNASLSTRTPLHLAAHNGTDEVVMELLARGSNPLSQTSNGGYVHSSSLPRHYSCSYTASLTSSYLLIFPISFLSAIRFTTTLPAPSRRARRSVSCCVFVFCTASSPRDRTVAMRKGVVSSTPEMFSFLFLCPLLSLLSSSALFCPRLFSSVLFCPLLSSSPPWSSFLFPVSHISLVHSTSLHISLVQSTSLRISLVHSTNIKWLPSFHPLYL